MTFGQQSHVGKYVRPSTHVGGPRHQITMLWTFEFWTTASKAKVESKEGPSSSEKNAELKWDELQAQTQQME
jgi:hypothetical protein